MSQFSLYFKLGVQHILDIYAVDHILFILSLNVIFLLRDWKRVIILVTSFTVGHSLTLGLAALNVVKVNEALVEFLIPVTIFLTALSNIFRKKDHFNITRNLQRNYFLAMFFGLIHGFGFSNYLRGLLGQEASVTTPLLAFNLGIEVGQIAVVVTFLLISFLFVNLFGINRRDWVMVISSGIAGIALTMMFEYKFW
ncbi:MAG: HupE/UreJ family protein [Cyclobacteriaceae bacterium]|nr:HupE/UreJ family protein [Cyclobacteriaceae bacterium]